MRVIFLAFALGLALFYFSLTPGAIAGMGYTGEEMRAGNQLLGFTKSPTGTVQVSRNGLVPVFLDLPFLATGRAVFSNMDWGEDLVLASEPAVLTAVTAAVILLWVFSLTGDAMHSFTTACLAAWGTLLFPYAYIGLEPKQTVFLLLTAFLALRPALSRSWVETVLFSLCASLAITAKSTGAFVVPATAYLAAVYCLRMKSGSTLRATIFRCGLVVLVPASLFLLNTHWRAQFWAPLGGTSAFIQFWMVRDLISPVLNFAAFFGSPNKGLWVFSPLCLLACYVLPVAWKEHRTLAVATLLALGGLGGGFSLLRDWSDETWGPRYLHSTVPLLMVVLGVCGRQSIAKPIFYGVAILGLIAAGLGVTYPYAALPAAANQTGQDTLEAYQGDFGLNHLRFNAKLLELWLWPKHDGQFTSERQWFYDRPKNPPPVNTIDLHAFTTPQPVLLRHWRDPKVGVVGRLWWTLFVCFWAGLSLIGFAGWRCYHLPQNPT